MTVVDTVDVSDICPDVDEVVIFDDDGHCYRARAFVKDDCPDVMTETDVDLTDYPAVVAVCRRAFDVRERVIFEPLPTWEPDEPI
jgi:hypothetical protein